MIRRADPADLAAIAAVFRAASLANEGDREALLAHPEVLEFPADAVLDGRVRVAVDEGVAQTQFGPAPRMRLSVRGA